MRDWRTESSIRRAGEDTFRAGGWATSQARRVRYDAEQLSADPRSRRSRTVGKDQLALVLDGIADAAYAYSFIATNEELDLEEEVTYAEWAFLRRTKVEELFRDTAHGAGLSPLPPPHARHPVGALRGNVDHGDIEGKGLHRPAAVPARAT